MLHQKLLGAAIIKNILFLVDTRRDKSRRTFELHHVWWTQNAVSELKRGTQTKPSDASILLLQEAKCVLKDKIYFTDWKKVLVRANGIWKSKT